MHDALTLKAKFLSIPLQYNVVILPCLIRMKCSAKMFNCRIWSLSVVSDAENWY